MLLLSSTAVAQNYGFGQFFDISGSEFFSDSVGRMSRFGIIRGYDNGRFGANDYVTRGQMAVILDRYDQQMVEPLRDVIAEMRRKLNLGRCGDSKVDIGEQCDDGNTRDNDGCSSACFTESGNGGTAQCSGGHRVGDSYPSRDGCNTCSCTAQGEVCTLRACAPTTTCYSSQDCRSDQRCSTELGDCQSNCPPGMYCPAVCSGTCVPKSSSSSSRSSNSANACREERTDYNTAIAHKTCSQDSDCTVFIYSCPFLTCGEAINKNYVDEATDAAQDVASCQQNRGDPLACASCLAQTTACVSNRCVLR